MDIQYITANDAYKAVQEGAILVDVREALETSDIWIDMEHIVNIPLSSFTEKIQILPKDKPLILCCAIGLASEKAAKLLLENKYNAVSVLKNGLIAWQLAELPLKTFESLPCQCQCQNNTPHEDENK